MAKHRPYLYYDQVVSLCETCLRRIEGKLVIQDNRVWMHKWCPEHGSSKVLIAPDAAFWRLGREVYIKPPEMPERFNTPLRWGCPYDCGLCPDHMQHSCLTVVEITEHCDLKCPVCYASSGPGRGGHLPLATVESMLDAIVANEGQPDVVQVSGGEPTTPPELFEILAAAKRRPIRHLMLNTNGVRIAKDEAFARRLAEFAPGFEIYLQFDSLEPGPLRTLRGADLRRTRDKALERLNELGLSTTLVMTVARGVNDQEIGRVLEFAAAQPCVRGVTLQPVQFAGRVDLDPHEQRLTLGDVRQLMLDQTAMFTPADVVPVPCNPDALAMAYGLKTPEGIVPLTGHVGADALLAGRGNTILFEQDPVLKERVFGLFSTNLGPEDQACRLSELLCCLPRVAAPETIGYDSVFRVLILAFLDAFNFDQRAMKKSCVHIVQPDGKVVPFESYNLLYRDEAADQLQAKREEIDRLYGMPAKFD